MSTPPDELDRLVDHVEVPEPEEVHLQQPELDDVPHVQLGDDLLLGALLLQRDDLDQRLGADDDPRRVDRVRAREALERLREVDDLLGDRIGVDGLAQLRARLQRVVERLSRAFGDELRDPVDDAVRDVEHSARVADGGARRHRREGDDLRHAVAPVALGDVVDDPVAAGDGEVDVHVRQVLARRVQEALEEEPVADRVDVGDLEAVGGEGARRRAAPGPDADPVLLREVDEVPDDEEVVREPHLLDRLELEAKPLLELRSRLPVPADEPLLAELDEVVERLAPVRHRKRGQEDAAELDLDRAALGDLERPGHGVLEPREVGRHLLRRLEEELVRAEAPVVGVLERVSRLDAEERLVRVGVFGVEVVDVTGGDEREADLGGERDEARVDLLLLGEPRVLDLDVRRVPSEDLYEPVEIAVRIARPVLDESSGDTAGQAARERDEPLRMPLEEAPVDPRLVVVALEVAEGAELDQVRVALVRLRQEGEVRVALRLRETVVGDVDLTADDGLHTVLASLSIELDGPCERAVVGERDGRHLEALGLLDERRDPARPVEDRVLRVDVQMDERRRSGATHGRASLLRRSDGTAGRKMPAQTVLRRRRPATASPPGSATRRGDPPAR